MNLCFHCSNKEKNLIFNQKPATVQHTAIQQWNTLLSNVQWNRIILIETAFSSENLHFLNTDKRNQRIKCGMWISGAVKKQFDLKYPQITQLYKIYISIHMLP